MRMWCAVLAAGMMLAAGAAAMGAGPARDGEPAGVTPTPANERLVGVAYTTWHRALPWTNAWGHPALGEYVSSDRKVIRQHAAWLADAGVDFILIDWSNQIAYTAGAKTPVAQANIEASTAVVFEEFAKLKRRPRISIMLGVTGAPEAVHDGRLQRKADQVWDSYANNPKYKDLIQDYRGKPLLVVYVNTPSPFPDGVPDWHDPRFTVRWMTGYVTQQPNLRSDKPGQTLVSKYGYWSWEDRGRQTFPVVGGHPEAMTIVASWRRQGKPGDPHYIPAGERDHGTTFKQQWARARAIGPTIALVVSWNEWSRGEQPSPEVSKDIEPSKEFGHQYLDLLKEEIKLFKAGK